MSGVGKFIKFLAVLICVVSIVLVIMGHSDVSRITILFYGVISSILALGLGEIIHILDDIRMTIKSKF